MLMTVCSRSDINKCKSDLSVTLGISFLNQMLVLRILFLISNLTLRSDFLMFKSDVLKPDINVILNTDISSDTIISDLMLIYDLLLLTSDLLQTDANMILHTNI